MSKKALIAMSGGVDSSVAAAIAKEKGYDCIGVTMNLSTENVDEKSCCTSKDIEDARGVAEKLNMPYYVFDFKDDFDNKVVKKFVNTYLDGGTPNPCVDCNRYIKFEQLMNKMEELGYEYVVTGHYAKVEYNDETKRYILRKGADESKDQSYVLYSLSQYQLSHTLFPLGDFSKSEIRNLAIENGFDNAEKKESQDICFVPDGNYAGFIEKYRNQKSKCGKFVLKDGTVVGKHSGIIRYTIGQRKGLGISYGKPLFVCSKCIETNTITVGDECELFSDTLRAGNINLISVEKIEGSMRCKAKIRYRQKEEWATVTQEGNELLVVFDEKQRAIAKGQAVVLYDGDIVIGGGTIL